MFALLTALGLAASPAAYAAQDSVAVLYRADTVLVQVNDEGAPNRLQAFLDWAGAGDALTYSAPNEAIRIRCARREEKATCTFRFFAAESVRLFPRGAEASVPDFSKHQGELSVSFASSNGDTLTLTGSAGTLGLKASKR